MMAPVAAGDGAGADAVDVAGDVGDAAAPVAAARCRRDGAVAPVRARAVDGRRALGAGPKMASRIDAMVMVRGAPASLSVVAALASMSSDTSVPRPPISRS